MDISAYLIELLRIHDCVIIPDLGGFVSNYRPAEMDLAGNTFNPPQKEIIFSSKLDKNDGLLVNHISETEGIGYIEARLVVSEFVDEVKSNLENGEKIELAKIGSLRYDRNERLNFEPDIQENLLLDAFGLESFQFPQIKHNEVFNAKRPLLDREAVRPVFNTRRIKRLAVGIPILLALLIIPATKSSWKNYSLLNNQTSGTASIELNQPLPARVMPSVSSSKETVPVKVVQPVKSAMDKIEPAVTDKKGLATPTPVVESAQAKYHLIGGRFKVRENAEKLLSDFRSKGYQSKIDQITNGTFTVIVQSYTDRNEAQLALNALREKEPQAGYWMQVK
jgi:nucleoid DNA-binding protein/cell division septation protein DedD